MIAALFVNPGGNYYGLPGVDPWDEARDARLYAGPWPVVAHPPCERWGRLFHACAPEGHPRRRKRGDDDGCFAAALAAVRRWGGVLEHPAESYAWRQFGMVTPPGSGGWVSAGWWDPGWTCCVEQGHFGHPAPKRTWLYAVRCPLPCLPWGASQAQAVISTSKRGEGRRKAVADSWRIRTPVAFRDLLLSMASQARPPLRRVGKRPEVPRHLRQAAFAGPGAAPHVR